TASPGDARDELVVCKYLVGHYRHPGRSASVGKAVELTGRHEVSGRIVRTGDENGPRPRGDRVLDAREVERPRTLILERVGNHVDRLETRQMLEERIARSGDKHLLARIAEQLEQQ